MSKIVWLASYPKSGNTWLRALLANYQSGAETAADINNFNIWGIASDRRNADEALGVECSDLTPDEVDRYRPDIYRDLARRSNERLFIKTHDACVMNSQSESLLPGDITQGALYIVRNPLDIAISFAYHLADSVDTAITRMAQENAVLARNDERLHFQLQQRILSWSLHVRSWIEQTAFQVHVIRYEDLATDTLATFMGTLRFLGIQEDVDRARRAVAFSSFEALRQQEILHGFRERPPEAKAFFRSGRAGVWREILTTEQANRVMMDHGELMTNLGYLSAEGKPE